MMRRSNQSLTITYSEGDPMLRGKPTQPPSHSNPQARPGMPLPLPPSDVGAYASLAAQVAQAAQLVELLAQMQASSPAAEDAGLAADYLNRAVRGSVAITVRPAGPAGPAPCQH
jgi:hypothetical protein